LSQAAAIDARRRRISGGALLLWWLSATATAAVTDPYPQVAHSYLLVRDGETLWQHEAEARLPAASLVKLLTALVLLDSDWSSERWLVVSARAANVEPSHIGLRAGEQVRAGAALAAMLIHSANDACLTLVDSAAADAAGFVARMNVYAAALGMRNSKFVDPCGFDAPNQYSTATDLLKLAQAANQRRLISVLVATRRATLTTRAGRSIDFVATNQLLGRLPGTQGMKTGYTQKAGQCLIALTQRGEHEVWLVMLGGEQRWWAAHGMIEQAFAHAATPRVP
jgi:serine-type D-Ala-D-Ala carboxypeptidase (penicillin-binding protein 5/6)